MKNIYLITILTLFISNCGEKVREEITERFDNGDKKLLVKYKGEGGDEVVVERITYGKSGDTLFWEKPLEDFYYEKLREEIIKRFDNGDKELLVKYKGEGNDKVVVERITYHENGDTLLLEKPLDKIYMKRLYIDGRLMFETNFKDDKKDGKWTTWHSNGRINYKTNYKDGKADGKWTHWYDNGQKMKEGTVKDGEKYVINAWNKDGELLVKEGNGKWIIYYESGKINNEGTYKDGKADGLGTGWYDNGQKKWEGTFKDGEKDGKWTYYYENGQKKEEVTYRDGELISEKCWDEDGDECESITDEKIVNDYVEAVFQTVAMAVEPPLKLKIVTTERIWYSMATDTEAAQTGILSPGEEKSLAFENQINVRLNQTAGISLYINGVEVKELGQYNHPAEIQFFAEPSTITIKHYLPQR